MNCNECGFYKEWFYADEPGNSCNLLSIGNFNKQTNCIFVNEDGTINKKELDNSPL